MKVSYVRIDGNTTATIRATNIKRFQHDDDANVALLSLTACGTGLNLTRANVALFAELYWSPGIVLQAEDRIHRLGQKSSSVRIIYLIARKTVDEIVWDQIQKKHNVLGATVGIADNRGNGMMIDRRPNIMDTQQATLDSFMFPPPATPPSVAVAPQQQQSDSLASSSSNAGINRPAGKSTTTSLTPVNVTATTTANSITTYFSNQKISSMIQASSSSASMMSTTTVVPLSSFSNGSSFIPITTTAPSVSSSSYGQNGSNRNASSDLSSAASAHLSIYPPSQPNFQHNSTYPQSGNASSSNSYTPPVNTADMTAPTYQQLSPKIDIYSNNYQYTGNQVTSQPRPFSSSTLNGQPGQTSSSTINSNSYAAGHVNSNHQLNDHQHAAEVTVIPTISSMKSSAPHASSTATLSHSSASNLSAHVNHTRNGYPSTANGHHHPSVTIHQQPQQLQATSSSRATAASNSSSMNTITSSGMVSYESSSNDAGGPVTGKRALSPKTLAQIERNRQAALAKKRQLQLHQQQSTAISQPYPPPPQQLALPVQQPQQQPQPLASTLSKPAAQQLMFNTAGGSTITVHATTEQLHRTAQLFSSHPLSTAPALPSSIPSAAAVLKAKRSVD
jgi:hypothetical protein